MVKLEKKIAGFCSEVKEAFVDIGSAIWSTIRSRKAISEKMSAWAEARDDRKKQARLNRQVRSQFIKAFNGSAKKKMTLEVNQIMGSYKRRNGKLANMLTRPYEAFSEQNMPVKIASLYTFSQVVRHALWPVVGIWGAAVPLVAMAVTRIALVYKGAQNKIHETKLAQEGLLVPCDFSVKAGKASIMGQAVKPEIPVGFPLMHIKKPLWIVSEFNNATLSLDHPHEIHAAEFEALRLKRVTWTTAKEVEAAFPDDTASKNCVFALSVIFPSKSREEVISDVKEMSAARVTKETVFLTSSLLSALEPFCLRGKDDAGLDLLSGKVTMNDIRFMAELKALGTSFGEKEGASMIRMLKDARFSKEMTFRQIVEAAHMPSEKAETFNELWKDREYRTRFGYEPLMEMASKMSGWGGVALRLSQHDYAKGFSAEQLKEMAVPENAYWAKTMHTICAASPQISKTISYEIIRDTVKNRGLTAENALIEMSVAKPSQGRDTFFLRVAN